MSVNKGESMITISKELALEILMKRVKYWTDEPNTIRQYEEYLEYWLELGEDINIELDPEYIIDNMWVNDIAFIDKEDIVDYDLECGAEISTADFCGTIEYIGSDFIVVRL